MGFNTEKEMSHYLRIFLNCQLKNDRVEFMEEFKGLFGIPDYILFEMSEHSLEYVIAIELKLKDWKRALKQAFKYRSFSHQSFVILDEASIQNAVKNLDYFKKFNIGLASFNKNKELKIFFYPAPAIPYAPQTVQKLKKLIIEEVNDSEQTSLVDKVLPLRNCLSMLLPSIACQ